MTDESPTPATLDDSNLQAELKAHREQQDREIAEHERRMREDREYRESREAASRAAREEEERQRRLAEQRRIASARSYKQIPAHFWPILDLFRAGSSTSSQPASIVTARAVVERFARGAPGWTFLVLAGPPGVGKTTAAAWWLDMQGRSTFRQPVLPPPGTQWDPRASVWEDVVTFHETYERRLVAAEELATASLYDDEYWTDLRSLNRLVIDDLGTEQLDGKGYALANIVSLLTYRHANALPTVITTNLRRADFEKRYGAHDGGRLVDRLKESARFEPINGPSLRRTLRLDGGLDA